jgi:hypothetical protein
VKAACRINIKKSRRRPWSKGSGQLAATVVNSTLPTPTSKLRSTSSARTTLTSNVPWLRHGLLVADLERSLVIAGESQEEYHTLTGRALPTLPAVFAFEAAPQQAKLAQACGYSSWRRLRAFRLQSEWAGRMMVHHLHEAIRWRQAASGEEYAGLGEAHASLGPTFNLTPERFVELGLGLRRGVES